LIALAGMNHGANAVIRRTKNRTDVSHGLTPSRKPSSEATVRRAPPRPRWWLTALARDPGDDSPLSRPSACRPSGARNGESPSWAPCLLQLFPGPCVPARASNCLLGFRQTLEEAARVKELILPPQHHGPSTAPHFFFPAFAADSACLRPPEYNIED